MNVATLSGSAVTPNFVSMVRAELFKLVRQRVVWITGIVIAVLYIPDALAEIFVINAIKNIAQNNPFGGPLPDGYIAHQLMEALLSDVRGLIGIFLMIITVSAIALEYQQGTIRILLARGVGRLRLLGSKLTAIGIVGLAMLAILLVLAVIMGIIDANISNGNLSDLQNLPGYFGTDTAGYLCTVLISMAVTVLLAAAFAVLGRSLAFGLSFALSWFFVESIISTILQGISLASGNKVWGDITQYFLGTNLTNMPAAYIPSRGPDVSNLLSRGVSALSSSVDATHTTIVTLIYAVVFLGVAGVLTWKRDVLQ
jgi:ABC-type transport system involved in multi-copper enzyme maturation permease subunit